MIRGGARKGRNVKETRKGEGMRWWKRRGWGGRGGVEKEMR
jgi:hypothetical protein